jgi:hypothetical protein
MRDASVDAAMRRILKGEGDADIAAQAVRFEQTFDEMRTSVLRCKAERDAAVILLRSTARTMHAAGYTNSAQAINDFLKEIGEAA